MRRLVLASAARQDLLAIDSYVMRCSGHAATARKFTGQVQDRCRSLAALPGTLGRARPEYGPDVRTVVHREHLILFRYEPGLLRVLRVIEGHRDVADVVRPDEA